MSETPTIGYVASLQGNGLKTLGARQHVIWMTTWLDTLMEFLGPLARREAAISRQWARRAASVASLSLYAP